MEYVTLNNAIQMPKLGLGTMIEPAKAEETVAQALDIGYRLIDTAAAWNQWIMHTGNQVIVSKRRYSGRIKHL